MIRFFAALLLLAVAVVSNAQQATTTAPASPDLFPDKPTLLHDIELNEAALPKAEAAHFSNQDIARIYSNLGGLYLDASLYLKSEDALRHAVSLLRAGPPDKLAEALSHLGMLHSAMDKGGEAEKDALEALRIREIIGDPVGLALGRADLATIYVKQHKYKPAVDLAQKSVEVLASTPGVHPSDLIAAQQALGYAFCGTGQCARAIPFLEQAVQDASHAFGPDSLSVGLGNYLLGYTCWQAGQMDRAADLMQRGILRMKRDMGWGHEIYLRSVAQYAQFLRKRGQTEAASAAEREVRQTTAIVDARSFTARQ